MKKSQFGGVLVPILIIVISIAVIGGVIAILVNKLDYRQQEEVCKQANRMAQQTDLDGIHYLAESACKAIDLGTLPMKGYQETKEGIMKNIADKTAKTWEIWLEGIKPNYFEGTLLPGNQRCFIQYTFNIKKGTKPIPESEFTKYLSDTLYKIDDTSDRCAGTGGGKCRENTCELGEEKVEDKRKTCIGTLNTCCIRPTLCESKGGICDPDYCKDGTRPYIDSGWTCEPKQICCISDSNYVTYLTYLQANTGKIRISVPCLVPQDYPIKDLDEECKSYYTKKTNDVNTKISETYAIVFSSRTESLLWPESKSNLNGIVIAPINEVSSICAVQFAE